MIDLHTHSNISDGTDAPEVIPELAKKAGCSAVALTDHDTLGGIEPARARADAIGIRLISGCEVSCKLADTKSAHMLCYFTDDAEGAPLGEMLAEFQKLREERNDKMVAQLAGLGLPITFQEVKEVAGGALSVGRPHMALVLKNNGAVGSVSEAFDLYLAAGRPGYVPKAVVTPNEVIAAAKKSGAVTVLAHPLLLGYSKEELNELVATLSAHGLGGIEAYYSRSTPDERVMVAQIAQRHGIVATGGSDYHGTVKPDLVVGRGKGDLVVPDSALEELEDRRSN
jgi:3',5'-nucleoside bisphosphate phosphatase